MSSHKPFSKTFSLLATIFRLLTSTSLPGLSLHQLGHMNEMCPSASLSIWGEDRFTAWGHTKWEDLIPNFEDVLSGGIGGGGYLQVREEKVASWKWRQLFSSKSEKKWLKERRERAERKHSNLRFLSLLPLLQPINPLFFFHKLSRLPYLSSVMNKRDKLWIKSLSFCTIVSLFSWLWGTGFEGGNKSDEILPKSLMHRHLVTSSGASSYVQT